MPPRSGLSPPPPCSSVSDRNRGVAAEPPCRPRRYRRRGEDKDASDDPPASSERSFPPFPTSCCLPSPPLPFPTASERCRGHAGVTHAVPDTASPLLRAKKDRLDLLFLPDESPEQERLCIIPYVAVFLLFSDELRRRFRHTDPSSSTLEHICRSTVSLRFFPLSLPSFPTPVAPFP